MSDDASTLTFTWATATDTGRHRSINQDSVLAAPGLFVVADGMGGASGGEVASATAIEVLQAEAPKTLMSLIDAVRTANDRVFRMAVDNPDQW